MLDFFLSIFHLEYYLTFFIPTLHYSVGCFVVFLYLSLLSFHSNPLVIEKHNLFIICVILLAFFYLFFPIYCFLYIYFFIVVQLQLSHFFPHRLELSQLSFLFPAFPLIHIPTLLKYSFNTWWSTYIYLVVCVCENDERFGFIHPPVTLLFTIPSQYIYMYIFKIW